MKKRKNTIYNLLLVISLCVFCFSAYQLISIYLNYRNIDKTNAAISNLAMSDPHIEERADPFDINTLPEIDFAALKALNSEIIGYMYIPNSDISFAITQSNDNDKYLTTAADLTSSSAGSLFLDYTNSSDFSDPNSIIYGHNMKNGSMFGTLKYLGEQDYLDEHPYVFIYTEDKIMKYQSFSFHQDVATGDSYRINFNGEEDFVSYLNSMYSRSWISVDTEFNADDKVITLSTCTNVTDEGRHLLHAKLVEVKYMNE